MGRFKGTFGPSVKVADMLPPGFDPEEVANFFSQTSSGRAVSKMPVDVGKPAAHVAQSDFGHDAGIEHVLAAAGHSQGHAHSMHFDPPAPISVNDVSDSDGYARPSFKGGGNNGGGKGKQDTTTTTTDPVVIDTSTTSTTTTTTTTTSTSIAPADYVSGLDTPNGYNVELMFNGSWTTAAKSAAYAAAEAISNSVTGDLPSYNAIDDIRITLTSTTIDGVGGTWGKGGYDILRSGSYLAATGHVTIDSADVPNALNMGLLDDLLMHEMLHAMGFGTAWDIMGLVSNYNGDLRFNGANATHVYNTEFASIASGDALSGKGVPIETDGGAGSAGKHWDEATFQNEIMTTTLNRTNAVSNLTIAALEDMGYQTIYVDEFLLA